MILRKLETPFLAIHQRERIEKPLSQRGREGTDVNGSEGATDAVVVLAPRMNLCQFDANIELRLRVGLSAERGIGE